MNCWKIKIFLFVKVVIALILGSNLWNYSMEFTYLNLCCPQFERLQYVFTKYLY